MIHSPGECAPLPDPEHPGSAYRREYSVSLPSLYCGFQRCSVNRKKRGFPAHPLHGLVIVVVQSCGNCGKFGNFGFTNRRLPPNFFAADLRTKTYIIDRGFYHQPLQAIDPARLRVEDSAFCIQPGLAFFERSDFAKSRISFYQRDNLRRSHLDISDT